MTSIPVNAFSAPHVRQVMQKQKLLDREKELRAKDDNVKLTTPLQIGNVRKSAPDCLDIAHDFKPADFVTNQKSFLDTFKNIIPAIGRKDLIGRSISCTEPRMEIHIDIKDFSSGDISSRSPDPSSLSPVVEAATSPDALGVERKRFRFLSGQ